MINYAKLILRSVKKGGQLIMRLNLSFVSSNSWIFIIFLLLLIVIIWQWKNIRKVFKKWKLEGFEIKVGNFTSIFTRKKNKQSNKNHSVHGVTIKGNYRNATIENIAGNKIIKNAMPNIEVPDKKEKKNSGVLIDGKFSDTEIQNIAGQDIKK